jgi:hypothetical protein
MDLLGVMAELGEVAAGVLGLDVGFGGEHGSPSCVDHWTGATPQALSRQFVVVKSNRIDLDVSYT